MKHLENDKSQLSRINTIIFTTMHMIINIFYYILLAQQTNVPGDIPASMLANAPSGVESDVTMKHQLLGKIESLIGFEHEDVGKLGDLNRIEGNESVDEGRASVDEGREIMDGRRESVDDGLNVLESNVKKDWIISKEQSFQEPSSKEFDRDSDIKSNIEASRSKIEPGRSKIEPSRMNTKPSKSNIETSKANKVKNNSDTEPNKLHKESNKLHKESKKESHEEVKIESKSKSSKEHKKSTHKNPKHNTKNDTLINNKNKTKDGVNKEPINDINREPKKDSQNTKNLTNTKSSLNDHSNKPAKSKRSYEDKQTHTPIDYTKQDTKNLEEVLNDSTELNLNSSDSSTNAVKNKAYKPTNISNTILTDSKSYKNSASSSSTPDKYPQKFLVIPSLNSHKKDNTERINNFNSNESNSTKSSKIQDNSSTSSSKESRNKKNRSVSFKQSNPNRSNLLAGMSIHIKRPIRLNKPIQIKSHATALKKSLAASLLVHTDENNPTKLNIEDIDSSTESVPFPECRNGQIIFPDGTVDGPCFENGAVSTEVPLCSEVGVDILKQGGNAVDAAIAFTICVGIVNSFSSGIGGGGFMLIRIPEKNSEEGDIDKDVLDMIDFRETAPANITSDDFQEKSDLTKKGGRAVGVPGEIMGMYEAHKKYGKMGWADLFTRNIKIARGFEVSDQLYSRLNKLSSHVFSDPGLREVYTRNGEIVKPKSIISRENYARTLEKIAVDPMDFYRGDIANDIIESVKGMGGVMEKSDLENYDAVFRDVLESTFMGYKMYTTNLPSSGLFVIEALNILEHFDLKALQKEGLKLDQYPHYHLLIEVFKFIAAKRGRMADPQFLHHWKNIVKDITNKKTAEEIAMKIDFNHVLDEKDYEFEGTIPDDHGTTHLNVIDKNEMVALVTSTINLEFGAKFMDRKTGIIFNDEMDDFYVPGNKNAFDLANMPKNIIKPDKRPFSSAAPFILVNYNEIIAVGAAGGTRIPTSLIAIVFHLILGKSLSGAIKESRIHNQFHPQITYVENDFPDAMKKYLTSLGHVIEVSAMNSIFTSVQGIHMVKRRKRKIIQAVSDERKGGASFGY